MFLHNTFFLFLVTESVSKMLLKQSRQTVCVHGNLQNIENLTKLTTDIFQFNTNFFLLPQGEHIYFLFIKKLLFSYIKDC